jgi:protein SCO1/2
MRYLLLLFLALLPLHATAQPGKALLDAARFDQHPGKALPKDAVFTNSENQRVRLGESFGERPVIVLMGYFECPQLCGMVYQDLARALRSSEKIPGADYSIVSVSIDPEESPSLAAEKKLSLTSLLRDQNAAPGLHFLVGDKHNIDLLAKAIGFNYAYDEELDQYAHPTGFVVTSPEGTITRYFIGLNFKGDEVDDALSTARTGEVSPPSTNLVLRCFGYDPTVGKHENVVRMAFRIGGTLTVLSLVGFIVFALSRDPNRKGGASHG